MNEKPTSYRSIFVERFNFLPCCVFFLCVRIFLFPKGEKEIKKKAMREKIKRIKNLAASKEKPVWGKEQHDSAHISLSTFFLNQKDQPPLYRSGQG